MRPFNLLIRTLSSAHSQSAPVSATFLQISPIMKVQVLSLAALAPLVSGSSLDDSPLNVELEFTGNTAVKARIKNTGSEDLPRAGSDQDCASK